ncbi:hypothetical protein QQ045_018143 [Rhodiola kirilowii]
MLETISSSRLSKASSAPRPQAAQLFTLRASSTSLCAVTSFHEWPKDEVLSSSHSPIVSQHDCHVDDAVLKAVLPPLGAGSDGNELPRMKESHCLRFTEEATISSELENETTGVETPTIETTFTLKSIQLQLRHSVPQNSESTSSSSHHRSTSAPYPSLSPLPQVSTGCNPTDEANKENDDGDKEDYDANLEAAEDVPIRDEESDAEDTQDVEDARDKDVEASGGASKESEPRVTAKFEVR